MPYSFAAFLHTLKESKALQFIASIWEHYNYLNNVLYGGPT